MIKNAIFPIASSPPAPQELVEPAGVAMAYPSSAAGFCAATALVVCGVADPTLSTSAGLASTGFNAAAWILGSIGMLVTGFILVRTAVFGRQFAPAGPAAPETPPTNSDDT